MRVASVCSGIEAASVAWLPFGWSFEFLSEIEKAPLKLLEEKYGQETTIYGDFTRIPTINHAGNVDVLIGGTPCQSFSVAGERGGVEDDRGNLALEFSKLARELRTPWFVWENVPGVFSSSKGSDFARVLSRMVGRDIPPTKWSNSGVIQPTTSNDYGVAWRVLDSQFFGVPQRRRRVFVIGYLGDWRPAASVLFEPESDARYLESGKEEGETVAPKVREGFDDGDKGAWAIRGNIIGRTATTGGNGLGVDYEIAPTFTTADKHAVVYERPPAVIEGQIIGRKGVYGGHSVSESDILPTITARHNHAIVYENHAADSRLKEVDVLPTIAARAGTGGGNLPIIVDNKDLVVFGNSGSNSAVGFGGPLPTLCSRVMHDLPIMSIGEDIVRYLTPIEVERAFGFPDNYTASMTKSQRYKALGNSMAVPVIRWLGDRIEKTHVAVRGLDSLYK